MKTALLMILSLTTFFITFPCLSAEPEFKQIAIELTEKGWRYFNGGDHDTALKKFRQATILDPDSAPAYYGEAYIYEIKNRLSLAIKYYRKAIQLADPPDTHTFGNLGRALMKTGRHQEGLKMLKKALQIDPDNSGAHISLAIYYCSTSNISLADKHLKKAKALGAQPDSQQLNEIKTKCSRFQPSIKIFAE